MYGITSENRKLAKKKVSLTKKFYKENFIKIGNDNIPLADIVSNSIMNTHRYLAEINNRVSSLFQYAQSKNLVNVFVTLSAESIYHPTTTATKGNRRVFNKKYGGRRYLCKIKNPVTNEKFKLLNPDENRQKYFPKQTSKHLSKLFKKLTDTYNYKSIPKEERLYFRVTEPHEDGTPHLHISFFMPENVVDSFISEISNIFQAPQIKIEKNVNNPIAYLMKYILKTFDDLRCKDELSDLSYWYILHGICRMYTSKLLISLDVYRLFGGRYTMLELTRMYKDKEIKVFVDPETNKPYEIFNKYGSVWQKKHFKTSFNDTNFDIRKPCLKFQLPQGDFFTRVVIDDKQYKYYKDTNELIEYLSIPISPLEMSDFYLRDYYYSLDVENEDISLLHFGITQNECVRRDLIQGEIQSLNDFNMNF